MDIVVKSIVVLFSGNGTNLEKIIDVFHNKSFNGKKTVVYSITNRPDAKGIDIAKKHGVKCIVIDHKKFIKREDFDTKLVKEIENINPSIVVMAGFMRIVTPVFTSSIKAINLHPSLLPLFKGANAIQDSFKSGMKVAGVTIHYVDETLDGGEIIDQQCVKIAPNDTIESFTKKIKEAEHSLLPKTIFKLLKIDENIS